MAFLAFFLIAIAAALVWHLLVQSFLGAVAGATIATVVVFQVVAFLQLGYFDPLASIAMVVTGAIAAVISALLGLPFRTRRKSTRHESGAA